MSNKPSKPPKINPLTAPGSPLRAVLVGLAVDIGGTALLRIVLLIIAVAQVRTPDMTESQLHDALASIPPQSALQIVGTLLGSLLSVAGGYVCARIVRRDEYRVGAVMAGVGVLYELMTDSGGTPADLLVLLVLCDIACNMLGVKYGAEHNRRLEAPATPPADTPTP
jgi:hypothetical protein